MTTLGRICMCLIGFCVVSTTAKSDDQDVTKWIERIRSVGAEGKGSAAAGKAWRELTSQGPAVLPAILEAIDGANPVAANYLRSAFETVAARSLASGLDLPKKQLVSFLANRKNDAKARRLAYEWLVRLDPSSPDRFLPKMLDDPSAELRRDAVAKLIDAADALYEKKSPAARAVFEKALVYARDRDQVEHIAERLGKLGRPIDLTKHFGFITRWMVIAPFDNRRGVGYGQSYPPERGVDLHATYKAHDGKVAKWRYHQTQLRLGLVDFNQIFGDWHGVVAYAWTVVESPRKQPVEIRAGSNNAIVIYLNGKRIYGREEYHHGMQMDQHVGRGILRPGRNEILVKVCQNEQEESWAQRWSFQLRITDHLGAPVPLTVRVPDDIGGPSR